MSDQQQRMEHFQRAIDNPSVANLNKRQRALAEDVISRALTSPVSVRTVIDEARTNLLNSDVIGEDRETAMAILVSLERSQSDSDLAPDGLQIVDPSNAPASFDERRASLVAAANAAEAGGNGPQADRIRGLVLAMDEEKEREDNDPEFQKAKSEAEQKETDRIQGFMDQSAELAERAQKVEAGEFDQYEQDVKSGKVHFEPGPGAVR